MSIVWRNYGCEFQAFKREIEKIQQENLHWDLELPLPWSCFWDHGLRKGGTTGKWEEKIRRHIRSLSFTLSLESYILKLSAYDKRWPERQGGMQAANLAWGGCVRKRKGAVPLCSNQAQETKSGGRNRDASGLVWTRRALRVRTSVTIEKLRWQKLSCIVKETVNSLKKPEW